MPCHHHQCPGPWFVFSPVFMTWKLAEKKFKQCALVHISAYTWDHCLKNKQTQTSKTKALGHIEHTAERDAAVCIMQSKVEVIWHLPYVSLWQILHRRNDRLLLSLFRQTCCDSSTAIHNVRVMQHERGMILFICLPDKRNLHQGD